MKESAEEMVFTASSAFDDPEQRQKFLDYVCRDDPGLRTRLDGLLCLQAEANTFFEFQPEVRSEIPSAEGAGEEGIGARIGRYRLLTQIGAGGYGAVYCAEQEAPVRRKVALKIVKLGMDTAAVVARFEQERQALAQMHHPNIAHVFDAGATASGRPYFVMELVNGEKITGFCDTHCLNLRQRLDLFVQVCRATHHAHQKGLIHRDIKPSNVLVHSLEGTPVPKIIDFGIAKATAASMTDDLNITQFEQLLGTPTYMSPEQAQGNAGVDTRSDIYSLGVVLYELLCGRMPFDVGRLAECSPDEVRRIIREEEPGPPSAALKMAAPPERAFIASRRGTEPARLAARLAGDLDWVVMRAMEKERSRRYESANGMAMDIVRSLNDEAVLARPPSRVYRLGKLARRNKLIFTAAGIATFGLLAGFGTSTWMFFRERKAHWAAEDARRGEMRLRVEADARAKIAQAALLINRHRLTEADRLMDEVEIPVTEPSLEATHVFRMLGNWNIAQGRWKTAANRFLNLERANQVDRSNVTAERTHDVLGAGPTLILAGDFDGYRDFVRSIVARFGDTTDPVAAEQILMSGLILPADATTLRQLAPLAKCVQGSIEKAEPAISKNGDYPSWRSLALALFQYRSGNFTEAVRWGKAALDSPKRNPSRVAATYLVLSMAYARLEQPRDAALNLAAGREIVEKYVPDGSEKFSKLASFSARVWHDWVIASLLCEEAERLIHDQSGE